MRTLQQPAVKSLVTSLNGTLRHLSFGPSVRHRPSMRLVASHSVGIAPWLGAALLTAACNVALVASGTPLSQLNQAALLVVLAGTMTAAGLLAARSTNEEITSDRDERSRPASDELAALAGAGPERAFADGPDYLTGMQWWTGALYELLDHAAGEAAEVARARELADAADDTRAMHDLLTSNDSESFSLNESAMLHSIATLWETGQERLEAMAADVDPRFYRRWTARTIVERRLRHGVPHANELVLPYR